VHPITEKLGRHGHGRELHQPDTAVYGHRCVEHDHGYFVARTAYSNGSESTNATGAKAGLDLYIWRWLSVSIMPISMGNLQADEEQNVHHKWSAPRTTLAHAEVH
jgi:hypothetical protein